MQQLDERGPAKVASLTVKASWDDGATWRELVVRRDGNQRVATIRYPAVGDYVSLHAVARGFDSNSVEQTTARAYALVDKPKVH